MAVTRPFEGKGSAAPAADEDRPLRSSLGADAAAWDAPAGVSPEWGTGLGAPGAVAASGWGTGAAGEAAATSGWGTQPAGRGEEGYDSDQGYDEGVVPYGAEVMTRRRRPSQDTNGANGSDAGFKQVDL